jgi:hypothetical protein
MKIREFRAAGIQGEGSLTIRVIGGCSVGQTPSSIEVSTWLQTDPADGFVPLTRRQDMTRAMAAGDAAMLRAKIRQCGSEE